MVDDPIKRRRTVAALIVAALIAAVVIVFTGSNEDQQTAHEFAEAWASQDFAAMHSTLSAEAQREHSVGDLAAAYEQAQETATVTGIGVGEAEGAIDVEGGKAIPVEIVLETGVFGEIAATLLVPVTEEGVDWQPYLVFPGLEPGEALERETETPERGSILAHDGSVIAAGPPEARAGEIDGATHIAGTVGIPTDELAAQAEARGFPADAPVGTGGLELILDERLAGRPGGVLLASSPGGSSRVLARSTAVDGENVKTTIDPATQAATTAALGAQYGGVAVLDEKGAILGLAGLAFSAPQPPGSTFKLVTAAAALEAGETSPGEEFPVTTGEFVGGREIENAHDELCGGTLVESFAHSCNSVFAPLGARVGGERLVEMAEKLGFNQEPDLISGEPVAAGTAEPSTIPEDLASELDVGVSAIGQGQVLATPLGLASATQAIAAGGARTPPYVLKAGKPESIKAVRAKTARQLTAMMEAVVSEGTATSAQIPGIRIAGKTGTAELGPKPGQELPPPDPDNPDAEPPEVEMEVDAWFTAFAPAQKPQLVVAVMLVNAAGDGGEVAAPIARQIFEALL